MFSEEFIRAFRSRSFLLAFVLGGFALGYGFSEYISLFHPHLRNPEYLKLLPPFYYNVYDAILGSTGSSFVTLIAPLIAVLPFSDSLSLDRVSGFSRFVLVRVSFGRYLAAKIAACMASGGVVLAFPFALLFVLVSLVLPRGLNLDEYQVKIVSRLESADRLGPWGSLYWTTPDLYILLLIALIFVFGAVYALFGLAIASVSDKRYIALATPFLLYMVAHYATAILGIPQWSPLSAFAPYWLAKGIRWYHMGVSLGIVLIISTGLLLFSVWRARDR